MFILVWALDLTGPTLGACLNYNLSQLQRVMQVKFEKVAGVWGSRRAWPRNPTNRMKLDDSGPSHVLELQHGV